MFDKLLAWGTLPLRMVPLVPLIIQAVDPNATDVANFFLRLGNDLVGFLLAAAGFSLILAAFFLMFANATGNERARTHAITSIYGVLASLSVALLASIVTQMLSNAVTGASAGGPGQ